MFKCTFNDSVIHFDDASNLATSWKHESQKEGDANAFRNCCFRKSQCLQACTSSLNSHE